MFANNNIFKDPFAYDLIVQLESGQLAVADLQAEHISRLSMASFAVSGDKGVNLLDTIISKNGGVDFILRPDIITLLPSALLLKPEQKYNCALTPLMSIILQLEDVQLAPDAFIDKITSININTLCFFARYTKSYLFITYHTRLYSLIEPDTIALMDYNIINNHKFMESLLESVVRYNPECATVVADKLMMWRELGSNSGFSL